MPFTFDNLARWLAARHTSNPKPSQATRRFVLERLLASALVVAPLVGAESLLEAAKADNKKKDKDKKKDKKDDKDGKWERAGKHARDEGVEEWKIDRKNGNYKVDFRHQNKTRSGALDVSFGGGGDTFTFVLKRESDRFAWAFSGDKISGSDERGSAFVARWDRDRKRWDTDRNSEEVAQRSRQEFRIGLAITSDLAPSGRSARNASEESEIAVAAAQGTCPASCCIDYDKQEGSNGVLPLLDRTDACDESTQKLEKLCSDYSGTCKGCCRVLEECSCLCDPFVGSDHICWCSRKGYPYQPGCRPR